MLIHASWYCKHNGECDRDLVDTEVESLHEEGDKEVKCLQVCLKLERLYLWLEMKRTMGREKRERWCIYPTPLSL